MYLVRVKLTAPGIQRLEVNFSILDICNIDNFIIEMSVGE